jgi:peptidoglycan L-alanyl-D-glutamate endopeptidase CwlK
MNNHLSLSMQRINTLDPKIIPSAIRVFDKCHKNKIPVYVVWGIRTPEEQDVLYRFGRSIPGIIQTGNRSGHSAHQYGLALDFCLLFNNTLMSWEDCYPRPYWRNKWLKVVRYFEEEGWTSKWRGYDFEPGHVENLQGNTINFYKEQNDIRINGKQDLGKQAKDQEFYI